MNIRSRLVLVGGFLGAGKTTLLREAALRLSGQGRAVGLITNDQAPDLVDTAMLAGTGAGVREVAGSCFCCNFHGFLDAVRALAGSGAEVIIGEPVGSCTDLSATILQPLKALHPEYTLAPLTVLLDPARAEEVLRGGGTRLHADAAYILRLQLEEADQILVTKTDTLDGTTREALLAALRSAFPLSPVQAISATTGEGMDAWLASVLAPAPAGQRIVAVDYDRYANGEAVLGWMNARAQLRWIGGIEPAWAELVEDYMARLHRDLRENALEIGHVKLWLAARDGSVAANLVALDAAPAVRAQGALRTLSAALTINARVQAAPGEVQAAVERALAAACRGRVAATLERQHCLQPGRPVPTHRYAAVIA